MTSTRKSRPPTLGFFVVRDVPAEHVGPSPVRRPLALEPPAPRPRGGLDLSVDAPFAPVKDEITKTVAKRRADPRADGHHAPKSEVAFGSAKVERARATVPARSNDAAVQAASKAHRILDELARCGPGAEVPFVNPMRALGAAGLEALHRDFPGLLWFDRDHPQQRAPRGRDVSPVLSLLYRFRPESTPIVARLLDDPDVDRRYYAMLLALDFADPALLDAVERRLFDVDTDIVALAMKMLGAVGGAPRIERVGFLLASAIGDRTDPERMSRGIELASALRHPIALDALIAALDSDDLAFGVEARRALRRLTAHDAGARAKDWAKFAKSHRARSRYAWLLEGLVGKDADLRDLAAAELALLTGETHGYRPGCPASDAKSVKQAYEKVLKR